MKMVTKSNSALVAFALLCGAVSSSVLANSYAESPYKNFLATSTVAIGGAFMGYNGVRFITKHNPSINLNRMAINSSKTLGFILVSYPMYTYFARQTQQQDAKE